MNRAQRRAAAKTVPLPTSIPRSRHHQLRKDLAAALREPTEVELAAKRAEEQEARVSRLGLTVVKAKQLLRIGGNDG